MTGRAAGEGDHYIYVLLNQSTGRFDRTDTIKLPSVTTVIGKVLHKESLLRWQHNQTRDNISGMVGVLVDIGMTPEAIVDMLTDDTMLREYLEENRLRPQDMARDRAEEGRGAHKFLEKVAAWEGDLPAPESRKDGYERAILQWVWDTEPRIVESEKRVKSLRHGFAGTMDIAYITPEVRYVKCDMKTREVGRGAYESDFIQVGAYDIADTEMGGQPADLRTVLIVHPDGTYEEPISPYRPEVFLDLLAVYNELGLGVN